MVESSLRVTQESGGIYIFSMTAVYVPQLSQRRVVMSDYRLNINPGNQLSATCFEQAGCKSEHFNVLPSNFFFFFKLSLLTGDEIMQIQNKIGSKTDRISM